MISLRDAITCEIVGIILAVFGFWSARHAAELLPSGLEPKQRRRRQITVFVTAVIIQILGVAFVVVGVWLRIV